MEGTVFANDAKLMSKGQVTIPKNVRKALGVEIGDRITFVVDGSEIRIMNSAVYALKRFQEQMKGRAEKLGFKSEDEVADWIMRSRRGENE